MSPNTNSNTSWTNILVGIGMPLVVLSLGGLVNWMHKLDDRQYNLSQQLPSEYVSKPELEKTIENINSSFKRLQDELVDSDKDRKMFEDRVLQKLDRTNEIVQDLALKLEKRTKD